MNLCLNCKSNQEQLRLLKTKSDKLSEQIELKNKIIQDLTRKNEQLTLEKTEATAIIAELQEKNKKNEHELACTFSAAK